MEIRLYKCEFCGEDITSEDIQKFGFNLQEYLKNEFKLVKENDFKKSQKHLCFNCCSVIHRSFEENRLKISYSKIEVVPR